MASRKRNIVVYDDEEKLRTEFVKRLNTIQARGIVPRGFAGATKLETDDFKNELDILNKRADNNPSVRKDEWKRSSLFDKADILVLDYRLFVEHPSLTSSMVAYLARCYSRCGLIVEMNRPPIDGNAFDLTLRGLPESFADVNIGDRQLDNPFLWQEFPATSGGRGLRPWSWPCLPAALVAFEKRIEHVRDNLDKPIGQMLGFPEEVATVLPRSVVSFLGEGISTMTPREFVMTSDNALMRADRQLVTKEAIARIAAARISKWLESLVLPGQDVLVDLPHLVHRFPSLLQGRQDGISNWQKVARRNNVDGLKRKAIKAISEHRLRPEFWVSRPVWFSPPLFDCQDILEVREPWSSARPGYVFCEDTSQFCPEEECSQFVIQTDSPYARRWVRRLRGGNYRPLNRFA